MDTDPDIKLQKASADFIRDFETSLNLYLRNNRWVSQSRTEDLVKLLEPFQEWPQLLDPHLVRLVPPIVNSYLQFLSENLDNYSNTAKQASADLIPLPRGICRLLYTMCKVRGYKVISSFLSNEPKYIEPLLSAYKSWEQICVNKDDYEVTRKVMVWEERFIMLLWISHLMLTPFDLALVAGKVFGETKNEMLSLPPDMPRIASYTLQVAISSLTSPSKEREASRILLVRLVLRPDMRSFNLLGTVLTWALETIQRKPNEAKVKSAYDYAGVLSFIAGVVASADSIVILPFLGPVFRVLQLIISGETSIQKEVYSSAVSRKLVVKTLKALTIQVLHSPKENLSQNSLSPEEVLEEVIDHLLTCLADKDTPVRIAASKAISVIAAEMDPVLAADIVEAVIGSLEENILWEDPNSRETFANHEAKNIGSQTLRRNLTAVSPLRWHGLILTLSQLLFRRSPPPDQLPIILNSLILALGFEQRSAVGASIGTSVRDAACFGIWSLARRYSTQELVEVDSSSIRAIKEDEKSSVLQILANEIVVASCLDPSGNIRRGASASLQELIGRHPDTIREGIPLVQIVDYHAVALRSRAMIEISYSASELNSMYWHVLLDGLLGWRGVDASDAQSRRDAATAVGELSQKSIDQCAHSVAAAVRETANRQVGKLHGLALSVAAIMRKLRSLDAVDLIETGIPDLIADMCYVEGLFSSYQGHQPPKLRPELVAEATCTLVAGYGSLRRCRSSFAKQASHRFNNATIVNAQTLQTALRRTEEVAIEAATAAAEEIFRASDADYLIKLQQDWLSEIARRNPRQKPYATISALSGAYAGMNVEFQASNQIPDSLLKLLEPDIEIETRIWTVRSLMRCALAAEHRRARGDSVSLCADRAHTDVLDNVLLELCHCMDDYTTDQRGDIGSQLRQEAIIAARELLGYCGERDVDSPLQRQLLSKLLRLAAEKLDKVRNQAWRCILENQCAFFLDSVEDRALTSSSEYFAYIMSFASNSPYLLEPILTGLITSASSGTESLICNSRTALAAYTESISLQQLRHLLTILIKLVNNNETYDRLLLPALDVLAFLGEINTYEKIQVKDSSILWKELLTTLQKSHYKSTNVRKILSCISCYCSLIPVADTTRTAASRLANFLMHRFPKVRNAAADALYIHYPNVEVLNNTDWADKSDFSKENAEAVKNAVLEET